MNVVLLAFNTEVFLDNRTILRTFVYLQSPRTVQFPFFLNPIFQALSFYPASVIVQVGLCQT